MNKSNPSFFRQPVLSSRLATHALAALAVAIFSFPVLWMVGSSFKSPLDLTGHLSWLFRPVMTNYGRLWSDQPILLMLANSAVVATCSTIISVTLGTAAAFGLAQRTMMGRPVIVLWLLFLRVIPPVMMFVPLYVLFQKFGLLDTHIGLVLGYIVFQIPFVILVMVSFLDDLPREIGEAAMLDGCSLLQNLVLIELPLVAPGIATTATFCLLLSWNGYIIATIISGPGTMTLPLAINRYVFAVSTSTNPLGPLSSVGTIIMLPALFFVFFMQRHLVRGMTLGTIK